MAGHIFTSDRTPVVILSNSVKMYFAENDQAILKHINRLLLYSLCLSTFLDSQDVLRIDIAILK